MSKPDNTTATPDHEPSRIREGLPFPLGATWDGLGCELCAVFRQRHQGGAVPVRRYRRG